MNNLQLCQRVHQYIRSGTAAPGTVPTTVVAQTGRLLEIVNFVKQAWLDIQQDHPDFGFTISQGTLALAAGTRTYLPSVMTTSPVNTAAAFRPMRIQGNQSRSRYAKIYLTSTGVSDEGRMYYVPYQDWRGYLDIGTRASGKPGYFTIRPDTQMEVDATPDAIYTVSIDYKLVPQTFAADADDPATYPAAGKGLQAVHHEAIVWKAVETYCITRGEQSTLLAGAQERYEKAMSRIRQAYLPEVKF